MKKINLFSDVTAVSRGARIKLKALGVLNPDDTVVSWMRINPFIRDNKVSKLEVKQLILLELTRTDAAPRRDLLTRLVNYLTGVDRANLRAKLEKLLDQPQPCKPRANGK